MRHKKEKKNYECHEYPNSYNYRMKNPISIGGVTGKKEPSITGLELNFILSIKK